MTNPFRPFDRTADSQGSELGFLEEARESFTQAFAYDHYQWPAFEIFGSARPGVLEFRTPALRAAEERGLAIEDQDSGDPVSLYTTTNSDIPIYKTGVVVPVDDNGTVTPQSAQSGPVIGIDDFRADARFDGIDGSGYAVVIIDSGIDLDDPFFGPDANNNGIADRIVYQYDFADNDANAGDVDGHGSNVASIAASSDSTYTGMAPGADIIALKAFSDSGDGFFSDIEESLQWVIANAAAYNIVSVNMSLGDGENYNAPIGLYGIADELATLASMNVIVVSSSGNDFYELNSVQGVAYPSADPNSLSVGAVYDGNTGGWEYVDGAIAYTTGADRITPFSQRDDQLSDIFAPGAAITGAGAGEGLVTIHGTSQAAPHITGIVALAQQLAVEVLGRKLTYEEFSDLLSASADIIVDGDDEDDNVANTGLAFPRVNMAKLGEAILEMAEPNSFSITALSAAKAEGNSGSTAFTFTVTRSGYSGEAASVDYAVSGGAVNGADFAGNVLPAGTVSFAAGETSKTLTILVKGDTLFEGNEAFTVSLSNASGGGSIATGSAGGVIVNDDAAPPSSFFAIAAADAVRLEGDAGTTAFTFTVTRSGDTGQVASVGYSVGGGAVDGADFAGGTLPGGTLSFAAGEVSKTLTVLVQGDGAVEADESFTVTLANPSANASITGTTAAGIIANDDSEPGSGLVLLQADFDATNDTEGFGYRDGLFGGSTFQRYASGDWEDQALRVLLGGVNNNLARNISGGWQADFTLSGETEVELSFLYNLSIGADYELDEYSRVLVSIDGGAPILVEQLTGNGNGGPLQTTGLQSISLALGSLAAGSHSIEIGGFNNQKTWSNEVSELLIDEVVVAAVSAPPPPNPSSFAIAALNAVKAEGDAGGTAFTFTVTRSGDTSTAAAVDYAVSGAANGADFAGGALPSGTLTFLTGETSKTLTITVAGDTGFEADEGFTVTLIGASPSAEIATASAAGTILNDDAAPPATSYAIAALDAVKEEGNAGSTAFTFTVTRSGDTSAAGSVDYAVAGAASGSDFAGGLLPAGTVSFAAGEASRTLTLQVAGDTAVEPDEAFTVTLANASNGAAIATASAGGTIVNDDAEPAVFAITADNHAQHEGDAGSTPYAFTVTRSGNLDVGATVDYGVIGGDAEGDDFIGGLLPGGTLSFAAGETSKTFTVFVAGDTVFEPAEYFVLGLSNPSPGATVPTEGASSTILNDDPAPPSTFLAIFAESSIKDEGDSGATLFTFRIQRSGDTSGGGSVDYSVSGLTNSAAGPDDFVGGAMPGGTLTFAAGETETTLTLEVQGDTEHENPEGFLVSLSNPTDGMQIAPAAASAFGTILNDDTVPTATFFSIAALDAVKAEGDHGGTLFTFTVTREGDLSAAGSVGYRTTGGPSPWANALDFLGDTAPKGVLEFSAGEATRILSVVVGGDTEFEGDESFLIHLENPSPGSEITTSSASGVIVNDDTTATTIAIAAADAVKPEGDSDTTPFTFTVTRSGDTSGVDTLQYALTGSQVDTHDFVGSLLPRGTLTFGSGEAVKTITIDVVGDYGVEIDETFTVLLLNPVGGAVITADRAQGTILNDDTTPTVANFNLLEEDNVKSEGDAGTTAFTFTIVRNGDASIAGSVEYAVSAVSADASDFPGGVLPRGVVHFAAGETSKTFSIEVAGDEAFEEDEVFSVGLSNASAGHTIGNTYAPGVILNDDPPPPDTFVAIAALSASKAEGDADATAFTFTVTRSGDTSAAGTVDYAVTGSANGLDFVGGLLPSGTLSFAAGETSKTLALDVAGDTALEANESFTVTLSNASAGSAITTASAQGTILNDDAAGPNSFSIAARYTSRAEGDDGENTPFSFEITRISDTAEAGSVYFEVTSSQADGSDFSNGVLHSGWINFPAGENFNVVTLGIWVAGDNIAEADETFTVTLSNPSAGFEVTTASASSTILNDDGAQAAYFAIAAEDAVKAEGDAGATDYMFTLTRSGDTSAAGSVDWTVSGGDSDAADFGGSLPGGTVSFAAGETTKAVTVQVSGDTDFEADEDFTVTLNNPSAGASITTGSAQGTILNDDPAPPATFLAIAALDAAKAEGDAGTTAFTFTVTRSGDTSAAGSVDYAVTGAADGADFLGGLLPGGTLSFAAGEVSRTLTVEVAGDTALEADEGFTVTLSNASAGSEIATASASGTILNDDAPPVYDIAAPDAVKAEGDSGDTLFTFTISRSGDLTFPGNISYSLSGHGANPAAGTDFASGLFVLNTATFAEGQSSVTINIRVAGDADFEADEGFIVTIFDPTHGGTVGTASATGTILNDDPLPVTGSFSIAAADAVKPEGDAGTTELTFTVTRSGDSSAAASVDYAMTSGGPNASDFVSGTLPSGTLNFAAGETAKTLVIAVQGDAVVEPDESFIITLSNPSPGSDIANPTAVGTIVNDDAAPPATFLAIAALDAAKAEGDADTTAFTFTVTRSGDTSSAGTVDYSLTHSAFPDGAVASDFAGGIWPSGTVAFTAGETSRTLTIAVAGDVAVEADETFTVTLSNPSAGAAITTASADSTIVNDDPAPPATFLAIAAADAVKAEGDAGSTAFTFTVTRTGDLSSGGTVDYAVAFPQLPTEAAATDFFLGALPSGTLSFADGEASRTLTLQVAGDLTFEPDESFTVTLSNASAGAAITTASAAGTILNDDAAPPTTFLAIATTDTAKAEGDAGTTAFTFTVTRSGDTSAAGSVDYAVTGAADGADFASGLLPGGTVSFAAGEVSRTLTVEVAGDTAFEADEGFTVTLSNASAGSAITTASAAGTIVNDDPAPPATFLAIAALDAVQAEGDAGTTALTFTVTRSGDPSAAGSVDYAVTGAADGADFAGGSLPGSTVSFAAGEVSRTLIVEVAGDTAFEADEGFTVTLSNASPGSEITTASAAGTIVNDDPAPPATFLAIAALDAVQSEGLIGETFLTFTVTRSGDTTAAGSVDYAVTGDVDGVDFMGGVLPAGTLAFAAGELSKTLSFNVAGDGDEEPDENLTVTLSNASAGAAITTASAAGTILNDDGPPEPPVDSFLSISAADAVKSEGDDGSTLFTFIVSRPGTIIGDASVDYTVTGSGSNPADASDFVGGILPSGTVTIQGEGASGATIVIAVAGDSDIEFDETFTVTLSNPSVGAAIVTASAAGTILNDDAETPPPGGIVLLAADFDAPGDTEGFVYRDGVFTTLPFQTYASGSWEGQALTIDLGGRDTRIATNIAGAWETDFVLTGEMEVTLSFAYELIISSSYEREEYSQLLVSIDGGSPILIEELRGGGVLSDADSVVLDLGSLGAGSHSLAIGGYNNRKSWSDEATEITIDDLLVTGTPAAGGAAAVGFLPGAPEAGGLQAILGAGYQENEVTAYSGF